MSKEILDVLGSSVIRIGNAEFDCYILSDGTPALGKGKSLKSLLEIKNLNVFISNDLENLLEGIEFKEKGKKIFGYHTDVLEGLCRAYLSAKNDGVISLQSTSSDICEAIIRAINRVGIDDLIREQIGYGKRRNFDALIVLTESYFLDLQEWKKTFPYEFFEQLERLYGNEKLAMKNRPLYYAKFIAKYIYEAIEKLNSDGNESTGVYILRGQIWQTLGVMKVSSNKRVFEGNYARLIGQSN